MYKERFYQVVIGILLLSTSLLFINKLLFTLPLHLFYFSLFTLPFAFYFVLYGLFYERRHLFNYNILSVIGVILLVIIALVWVML